MPPLSGSHATFVWLLTVMASPHSNATTATPAPATCVLSTAMCRLLEVFLRRAKASTERSLVDRDHDVRARRAGEHQPGAAVAADCFVALAVFRDADRVGRGARHRQHPQQLNPILLAVQAVRHRPERRRLERAVLGGRGDGVLNLLLGLALRAQLGGEVAARRRRPVVAPREPVVAARHALREVRALAHPGALARLVVLIDAGAGAEILRQW